MQLLLWVIHRSNLLEEVWLFIAKIPSHLLANTLDCFVPMYSGDYIVEVYTLNISNVI